MKENKKTQFPKNETLSKINKKFLELKKSDKLALMPFIMAGDPNIETTSEILLKLQEKGADLIELGIPYSDPLADGPIIQLSASRALKSGTTLKNVIQLLESLKDKLQIPIILFTYFNPVLNFGLEKFCKLASKVGVSGLIIPDLPLEEAYKFSEIISSYSIDLILLVAPTTPSERMKIISNNTKGFTYLVSIFKKTYINELAFIPLVLLLFLNLQSPNYEQTTRPFDNEKFKDVINQIDNFDHDILIYHGGVQTIALYSSSNSVLEDIDYFDICGFSTLYFPFSCRYLGWASANYGYCVICFNFFCKD